MLPTYIIKLDGLLGGQGDWDIWWASRPTKESNWSTPMNLSGVNSQYREFAPFFSIHDNALYFESTRPGGLGDKDIWVVFSNSVPSDIAHIPAGTFQMGDSFSEDDSDERPVHTVTLDSFYIGKYEITNGQYCAFLNSALGQGLITVNPSGVVYKAGSGTSYPYCNTSTSSSFSQIAYSGGVFSVRTKGGRNMSNDPMVCVSWYGAVAYCNWRSQQEGKEQCYNLSTWACDFTKKGYRLPTEAEWEYAARGGLSGKRFPWGDTITHSQANYHSSSWCSCDISPTRGYHPTWNDGVSPYTSPVGSFAANGYGLYDMAGNVWEWGNDWYDSSYYSSSPSSNPTGPTSGSCRILRGGCWGSPAGDCRVAYRCYTTPGYRDNGCGFRISLKDENFMPPNDPPEPEIPVIGEPITAPPNKNKLIVITHGWQWSPNLPDWVINMQNAFRSEIDNSVWDVQFWDWTAKAYKFRLNEVFANAVEQGNQLGKRIAEANQWQHVHLIAHSAGAGVIASAADELIYQRAKGKFSGTIHLTFLDPLARYGAENTYGLILGPNDWADNYYTDDDYCYAAFLKFNTCTDISGWTSRNFHYAHNVDISRVDHGINDHDFPHEWYYATITGHYPAPNGQPVRPLGNDNLYNDILYGFPLSLEAGQANWQESRLTFPVGNSPIHIGLSLGDKMRTSFKSAANKVQNFIESYVVSSTTGDKNILATGLQMFTQSPVWTHTLLEMPSQSNYIKFDYQFTGTGDGYLTVYFNENLILIGDQRFDANDVHNSGEIYVGELKDETNWLTFRLDRIGEEQASISISNIEIGTITNKADLDNDLIVNLSDFAVFSNHWLNNDCNEANNWCDGCDFDENQAVDPNDLIFLAGNWLWKPPERIKSDLNLDSRVNLTDLNILASQWSSDCVSPDWCYGCDFNKDGVIDISDLIVLAEHWLEGT